MPGRRRSAVRREEIDQMNALKHRHWVDPLGELPDTRDYRSTLERTLHRHLKPLGIKATGRWPDHLEGLARLVGDAQSGDGEIVDRGDLLEREEIHNQMTIRRLRRSFVNRIQADIIRQSEIEAEGPINTLSVRTYKDDQKAAATA